MKEVILPESTEQKVVVNKVRSDKFYGMLDKQGDKYFLVEDIGQNYVFMDARKFNEGFYHGPIKANIVKAIEDKLGKGLKVFEFNDRAELFEWLLE